MRNRQGRQLRARLLLRPLLPKGTRPSRRAPATRMPFPALARDDPRFAPITGYWRGPVWLDQAYFGVEALRHYGYGRQADAMARRLVVDATGLTGQAPIYENYDPLTGQGYQVAQFQLVRGQLPAVAAGWSSATPFGPESVESCIYVTSTGHLRGWHEGERGLDRGTP